MKKDVVLVKIGGGLICDKRKKRSVRKKVLQQVCRELAVASKKQILIVGHGAGSFAHVPAVKYKTHLGIFDKSSIEGMVETAMAARELNMIVMKELVKAGVRAIAVSPMSMMMSRDFSVEKLWLDAVEETLRIGVAPVVYGDVVVDSSKGCTILSTERVLRGVGLGLKKRGVEIRRMIHLANTNGVYDGDRKTIKELNNDNIDNYKVDLGGSGGADVTGGMLHKVEEALDLAGKGIEGVIVDGRVKGNIVKAVRGERAGGTLIT